MKMRKALALLLAFAMVLTFAAACQPNEAPADPPADPPPAEEQAEDPPEEPANDGNDEPANDGNDAGGDIFDVSLYVSDQAPSDWEIVIVTKDATAGWFQRMELGLDEYAAEFGLNVRHEGPVTPTSEAQVQVIEDLIAQGVDAIGVVPIDPGALEAVLQRAMEAGIVVVSHESTDLEHTLFNIEAFTADDFGGAIMDSLAAGMGEEGLYAMMVAYVTSTTHMEYANAQLARQLEAYPNMQLLNDTVPSAESEESVATAYERAREILIANPDLAGFTGVASTDSPGIAQAVEELGLEDQITIVGVGTPNEFRPFVERGTISEILLWDPAGAGQAMLAVIYMIKTGEYVGAGMDLGIEGYENVTLMDGINRTLIGQADLRIDIDNIGEFDF